MSKPVLLDELHLTFRIPATTPEAAVLSVRRVLMSRAFATELNRAVRSLIRTRPALSKVRVAIAR